eukprot:1158726-Pelagomonas_calceolata.AAC.5
MSVLHCWGQCALLLCLVTKHIAPATSVYCFVYLDEHTWLMRGASLLFPAPVACGPRKTVKS